MSNFFHRAFAHKRLTTTVLPASSMHRRLQHQRIEWFVLLVLLIVSGSYLGYLKYQNYLQIEPLERQRLLSGSTVIEKSLVPQFFAANNAMEGIRDNLIHWQDEKDGVARLNRHLTIFCNSLPGINTLSVVNSSGMISASNNGMLIGTSVLHQEWFKMAASKNEPKTLYFTSPYKTNTNNYVLALVRTIIGVNGEFSGAVYASIDPVFIKTTLNSVIYTPDAWSSIIHGDGKLFMMMPEKDGFVGTNLDTPKNLFRRHKKSGQLTSIFADTIFTGEQRMVVLRTIYPVDLFMDKPMIVTVSRDLKAVFAVWRRNFISEVGLFFFFTFVTIFGLCFYQRRQRIYANLTDRQQHALETSEAHQHAIFDASPDALLISDEQGIVVQANQQVERLLGYTVDEVIGKSIESLMPERFREKHPKQRAEYSAAPTNRRMGQGMAVMARRKNGIEFHVEVSLGRIKTKDGMFYACALRDISERKQAETDLRISAAAFESQEGMMITDANRMILRVNRAFINSTGYSAEEVVGKTPDLFKSDHHDSDFYNKMWQIIDSTGVWQGEIWDRCKNGEVYPKWLTMSAVKNDSGAVTHYIGTHFDITERKKTEEKINTLAFYDQLTGLPNRTLLLDRLKLSMKMRLHSANYTALMFIDLDNFKSLNDTLGHDVGDSLLKQVAQRLLHCMRDGDTVARLGGDEFVVVLASLSANEVDALNATELVAKKILTTLSHIYLLGSVTYKCTASIGATLFLGDVSSIDGLMKQADLAMYRAKQSGRNAVSFFVPEMEASVAKRVAMEQDLNDAIQTQQFVLHYQVQVVGIGHATGAEVLLRWHHPQRGMISPLDFIPLAEETGLILPLGQWVLEAACAQLAIWSNQSKMAHLTLAVNVSAHQFRQPDFVVQVLAIIKATGANPKLLKLELTESLLVDNVEDTIESMRSLKAAGVGFSLDDFGTGYSSLSYLKRLPLDQLKIDQSFVRDVLIDLNDAAIARTIVALADGLGLGVIAEGVETEGQRDFLESIGCHAYQGYFFSRPLPLDNFEKLFEVTGHASIL